MRDLADAELLQILRLETWPVSAWLRDRLM